MFDFKIVSQVFKSKAVRKRLFNFESNKNKLCTKQRMWLALWIQRLSAKRQQQVI